jgi:hypothetical protein
MKNHELKELKPLVLESKQTYLSSAPEGDTVFPRAVYYINTFEKIVQNRRAVSAASHKTYRNARYSWRIVSEHPVLLSTQHYLICLLFYCQNISSMTEWTASVLVSALPLTSKITPGTQQKLR